MVECSGRGLCDRVSGMCDCDPNFRGDSCQHLSCPRGVIFVKQDTKQASALAKIAEGPSLANGLKGPSALAKEMEAGAVKAHMSTTKVASSAPGGILGLSPASEEAFMESMMKEEEADWTQDLGLVAEAKAETEQMTGAWGFSDTSVAGAGLRAASKSSATEPLIANTPAAEETWRRQIGDPVNIRTTTKVAKQDSQRNRLSAPVSAGLSVGVSSGSNTHQWQKILPPVGVFCSGHGVCQSNAQLSDYTYGRTTL